MNLTGSKFVPGPQVNSQDLPLLVIYGEHVDRLLWFQSKQSGAKPRNGEEMLYR